MMNRNIDSDQSLRSVLIEKVEAEHNEMYGNINERTKELLATHWRIYFNYNGRIISRALPNLPCSKEIIVRKKCYVKIYRGRLGFELIDDIE